MDISKFKNIILCVLLAANLVLAAVLGVRAYENYRLDRTAAEDTVSALRSLGTNVELEQLDTDSPPLYPSEVERDLEAERELARSFIGEHTIAEGGSGIYRLEGSRGSAGLQNAGRMTITFSDELSANFSDAEEMFRTVGVDSEYYAAQLGIYSDELVVSDTGMSRRISGAEVFGLSLDARVVDGGVEDWTAGYCSARSMSPRTAAPNRLRRRCSRSALSLATRALRRETYSPPNSDGRRSLPPRATPTSNRPGAS